MRTPSGLGCGARRAAWALGLADEREIARALGRVPQRKRSLKLRKLLADHADEGFSRSKGERRMRSLLRGADLPPARLNTPLHGFNVDCLWPKQRLAIEVDGFRFHGDRAAFERDRRRDQTLVAAGYRVIRITWRQLEHEPLAVVARLAAALAAAA